MVSKRKPRRDLPRRVGRVDGSIEVPMRMDPVPPTPKDALSAAELGFDRKSQIGLRFADLLDDIAVRVTLLTVPSVVVRRDLRRYYELCAAERAAFSDTFGAPGWSLLRAATAHTTFDSPKAMRMLWAHVVEQRESLDELYGAASVDRLIEWLRASSLATVTALVDALESLAPEGFIRETPTPPEVVGPPMILDETASPEPPTASAAVVG